MNERANPKQFTIIPIADGVPMPAEKMSRNVYPFAVLKVGQSFAYPEGIEAKRCHKATGNANRRHKPKIFRTRTLPTEIRCWRIA